MSAVRIASARLVVSVAVISAGFAVGVSGSAAAATVCGTSGVQSATATTASCAYSAEGEDTFVVPPGVTSIHVVAVGGPGENGQVGNSVGTGGSGARVTADIPVTPGDTLFVDIGGGGQTSSSEPQLDGGKGGDASDIRLCSQATCVLPSGTDTRLIVAGGGGGGGLAVNSASGQVGGNGGNAGIVVSGICAPGGDGGDGSPTSTSTHGRGGQCNAGGAGGSGTATVASGSAGFGGDAGDTDYGAGGAGFFGGGSGNEDNNRTSGGGGGGSSFVESTASNVSMVSATTGPSVTISYNLANLALSLTAHPRRTRTGRAVLYTVTISNAGADASGVVMTDTLPTNSVFRSVIPTSGDCVTPAVLNPPSITCTIGTLGGGDTWTAQILVKVRRGRTLTDSAVASASPPDADLSNDSASVTTHLRRRR